MKGMQEPQEEKELEPKGSWNGLSETFLRSSNHGAMPEGQEGILY